MNNRKRMRADFVVPVAAIGVLSVAALVWMLPAYACTVQAHLETRPRRADPGAVIRVEGSLFEAGGGPVNVYWGGEGGIPLGSATQAGGAFAIDVRVPANAMLGQEYQVSAVQADNINGFPYRADTIFRTSRPAQPPEVIAPPVAPAQPVQNEPAQAQSDVPVPAPAAQAPAAQPAPPAAEKSFDPSAPPQDLSGFSSVSPFGASGQVTPLVIKPPDAFGQGVSPAAGRSPWVLLPLGLIGLTLFSAAGASVLRQARAQGVRARA